MTDGRENLKLWKTGKDSIDQEEKGLNDDWTNLDKKWRRA